MLFDQFGESLFLSVHLRFVYLLDRQLPEKLYGKRNFFQDQSTGPDRRQCFPDRRLRPDKSRPRQPCFMGRGCCRGNNAKVPAEKPPGPLLSIRRLSADPGPFAATAHNRRPGNNGTKKIPSCEGGDKRLVEDRSLLRGLGSGSNLGSSLLASRRIAVLASGRITCGGRSGSSLYSRRLGGLAFSGGLRIGIAAAANHCSSHQNHNKSKDLLHST